MYIDLSTKIVVFKRESLVAGLRIETERKRIS